MQVHTDPEYVPISELGLRNFALNALADAGVEYAGELLDFGRISLIRYLGIQALILVALAIHEHNIGIIRVDGMAYKVPFMRWLRDHPQIKVQAWTGR